MDRVRALRIALELAGKAVGGWLVGDLIDNGKSALVVNGEKDGRKAALKVFDPELVERFGPQVQLKRIERELTLRGVSHEHLVGIYDGGQCPDTGYQFVAMEFVGAPNLAKSLGRFPRDQIRPIIAQVASAARFLEQRELVHRDIKPENIAYAESTQKAVLLDLGVVRPVGGENITDLEGSPFVGTLRYAPPEFLYRKEEDAPSNWRAITFYQLGAVLHDLIMRRPLFEEYSEPFASLVDAVREHVPRVAANDVSPDLVKLARNCLVKDPARRLEFVGWRDFAETVVTVDQAATARQRVLSYRLEAAKTGASPPSPRWDEYGRARALKDLHHELDTIVARICAGQLTPFELRPATANVSRLCLPQLEPLSRPLTIFFVLDVLDHATQAVSVGAACVLSSVEPDVPNPDRVTRVYHGVVQHDVLAQSVESYIFLACDRALAEAAETDGELWLSVAPGEVAGDGGSDE